VEAPSTPSGRRTLTPAVLLAVIFTTACALASVAFVAGRGGLDLPLAMPGPSEVALASVAPTPTATSVPSSSGTAPTPSGAPVDTPAPTTMPAPTPGPTPDPLTALPACPDRPGCYEYAIRRGDTLSAIADHWRIPLVTLEALNPEVTDPSTIVVGQVLYLARSPFARLQPCGDVADCYLYVVRPGDRLSTIADRFGVSLTAILGANPRITDANAIYSGQTIRLPGPTFPCCT
jgi:hypothetical protein